MILNRCLQSLPTTHSFATSMIVRFTFFLIAILTTLSCQGAIRNSQQLQKDPFFSWQISKHKSMPASQVLEKTKNKPSHKMLNDQALAYTRLYKVDRSERILLGILAQDNTFFPAYLNLSRLYSILNESQRMQKLYKRMVHEKKFTKSFLYKSAQGLANQNRKQEAIMLMETIAEYKKHTSAFLWLAAMYYEKQQYNKALESFEKILIQEPNHAQSFFGIASIYYQGKSWELALAYFQESQKKQSKEKGIKFFMANCLARLNKTDKALKIITTIPKVNRNFSVINLQGNLLLRKDFSQDLRFLLKEVKEKSKRSQLKKNWFAGEDLEIREKIIQEFKYMN